MEIKYNKSIEELVGLSRKFLFSRLFERTNSSILFLSSGGSAFQMLPEIPVGQDCSFLTLGVIDERFSPSEEINNFLKFKKTNFFQNAVSKGARTLDSVPKLGETTEFLSKRMEEQVMAWVLEHPQGEVVTTFGVGVDGHTMGVFPKPEDGTWFNAFYNDPVFWVRSVVVGGALDCENRISFTNSFVKEKINFGQALVLGEDKKQVLKDILENTGALEKVPGRIWREVKDMTIFTDIDLEK